MSGIEQAARLGVVTMEFDSGGEPGSAVLSWGQQHIWDVMCWLDDDDPYFNIPWVLPVRPAATLEQAVAALRTLIERHESLRTTFRGRGLDARQHILPRGSVLIQLRPAGDVDEDADPLDAQALSVAIELTTKAFDLANEPPLRCAALMVDGRPTHLCFAMSHATIDAWSLKVLEQQWEALLRGEELPPQSAQPRDRALFEAEEGAVRGEQSLNYWRNTLAKAPATLFPEPLAEAEEPRYIRVYLRSDALAAATGQLAKQCSVSTASVACVVWAALVAGYAGSERVAMQLIVANRHDARTRDLVSPTAQDGLYSLNIGSDSVVKVLQRGHIQAMACYRFAHYPPAAGRALRAEAASGSDRPVDLSVYFNDVRAEGAWHGLPEQLSPQEYERMVAERSRLEFVGSFDKVDAKAFFALGPSLTTGEVNLTVDTAYFPREVAFRLLRATERVVIEATADPEAPLADLVARALGRGEAGPGIPAPDSSIPPEED